MPTNQNDPAIPAPQATTATHQLWLQIRDTTYKAHHAAECDELALLCRADENPQNLD